MKIEFHEFWFEQFSRSKDLRLRFFCSGIDSYIQSVFSIKLGYHLTDNHVLITINKAYLSSCDMIYFTYSNYYQATVRTVLSSSQSLPFTEQRIISFIYFASLQMGSAHCTCRNQWLWLYHLAPLYGFADVELRVGNNCGHTICIQNSFWEDFYFFPLQTRLLTLLSIILQTFLFFWCDAVSTLFLLAALFSNHFALTMMGWL